MVSCPSCSTGNADANRFCMGCGSALPRSCPSCGAEAPPEARFCGACGSQLAEAGEAEGKTEPASDSLARYVPGPLAEKIRAAGGRLAGERRQVTVLFCDLADSTGVAERIGAEDYRLLLDEYLKRTLGCVHRYEGVVNQFAGDGIMAIFGAPIAHDDDAGRACRAALDILSEIRLLSRAWHERVGQKLEVRVGLNTGLVIAGSVGSDLRMEYTAVGDTTNVASRIEAYAPPGEVYLSGSTRKLVAHQFELEEVATQAFKGKSEKTAVYRLMRAIPRSEMRHHQLRGGLARFLGRHTELALLRERFDAVRSGQGQVVFVSGEAGIGKSRLLHEMRRQLDPESFTWVEGQCVSYGTGTSFLPVVDLLRGFFEIDEGDSGKVIEERVHERCAELGDAAQAGEPFFRDLLCVDPGDERVEHLQELHKAGFIFESTRDLVHALAQKKPVVLMIEDVHWIDQSSEVLLRRLFDTLATVPVLALVTHRSEYAWPHGERDYFSRVRLPGLPPALVEELTRSVLGREDVPATLKRVVSDRSDGNPFFVEEVAKALEERGVLDANPSEARLWDEVPTTVQEVLLARIDRLDERARRTLQIAAVIGREFTVRVLERLSGDGPEGSNVLDDLRGLELIYEKAIYPDLAYMFKHALTHDVAYQTLLERERRELHHNVAVLIEELYAERLPEFHETLAHQYEGAGVPERAAHYALLAGERAAKNLSPEAAGHFERAAQHARGRDDCEEIFVRAQTGMAEHWLRLGRTDDAVSRLEEAIGASNDEETRERLRRKIPRRSFLVRDGVRLAYYLHGRGAVGAASDVVPIVFLHPMIQGSLSFEDLAQRMCQEHCIVHMDPRGTGASDRVEGYDFGARAADAIALLKELPFERFILIVDSDGVRIAFRAYHAMPERIERLILFGNSLVGRWSAENPLGRTDDEIADLEALLELPFDELMNGFWDFVAAEPGMSSWRELTTLNWKTEIGEDTIRAFLRDALLQDESQLLEGVKAPTLVIAAENDVEPVERIFHMADRIEGAERAMIEGASHMAPWSAIDTFCAILDEFIKKGQLSREVWPRV